MQVWGPISLIIDSQMLRRTHEVVKAVLVLEAQPLDLTWRELCASLDVLLCWAPAFDGLAACAAV